MTRPARRQAKLHVGLVSLTRALHYEGGVNFLKSVFFVFVFLGVSLLARLYHSTVLVVVVVVYSIP